MIRRLAPSLALVAAFAVAAPLAAQTQSDPEDAAIRVALEHYLAGHATGDGAHHRAAFHKVANLYFVRGDTVATRSGADYIAGAPGKPAADEAQRRRRILMIDRTGDAAVAKIELDYPNAVLTDYMALLKTGGEWKIVNKIFSTAPKTK